jgi:hypothetical protein
MTGRAKWSDPRFDPQKLSDLWVAAEARNAELYNRYCEFRVLLIEVRNGKWRLIPKVLWRLARSFPLMNGAWWRYIYIYGEGVRLGELKARRYSVPGPTQRRIPYQAAPEGARIHAPPGSGLRAFAHWWCSPKTVGRILEPTITDLEHEYCQALSEQRPWKARWVRVRGTLSFFEALIFKTTIARILRELGALFHGKDSSDESSSSSSLGGDKKDE